MSHTEMNTAQDLVTYLTDQHQQVKDLMPKVLDLADDQRREAFTRVRRMLAVHEALEQSTVHLLATTEVSPEEAAARVQEETAAESAISELESGDAMSPDFEAEYRALCSDVVDHAEHEEKEEFGQLTGDLTDQARAKVELAEQLQAGTGLMGESFKDMFASAHEQLRQLE
ncbi:hypothetical protein GCM10011492_27380 [Flexivirga endophytica]|uniref:Hemerythrin-like domain-containing protein n=1 Tax=Flexivirga endophytica TaxID=1849103 RepID=A0A916WWD8_9MICO|nr:hemerythrin domain-containing protein [Flexivirga endophytica]GGB35235.1 hypothetical protein GCM10011492_27380 [Flexivirga endophytica]GHB43044.1 hypothetical protein GCM10008112_09760 [Flexivirga endophytica]